MKVLSLFLALINALVAGLVVLSCLSTSNLHWNSLSWFFVRITTGTLVLLISALTFRDGIQPLHTRKMLAAGLLLVLLGAGSAMWGVHLSILNNDVENVILLFGISLALQGIASVLGLIETDTLIV